MTVECSSLNKTLIQSPLEFRQLREKKGRKNTRAIDKMKIYEPLDSRNSTGLTQALVHEQCNMDGGGIQVALTATAELHRPLVVSGKESLCIPVCSH